MEGQLSAGPLPEQMDLSLGEGAGVGVVEDMEVEEDLERPSKAPTPSTSAVPAVDPPVTSPPGSALTRTPLSSPHGYNLTRSSSSDSLHSGGQPGLVRQRAQEIETRMRLAGLTLPSLLKRSSSLAKLGGLTFSTEDLSMSASCTPDLGDAPRLPAEPPACPSSTPEQPSPSQPSAAPWS